MDFIFERIQALDQTITQTAPFKVIKTDPEKGKELITDLVKELAAIDLLLEPFIPETSKKIIEAIMANKKPENLFTRKD
jgi:methionyl-tRNA synthetase